jgi:uncharacterized protein with FMN-binding domain
MIQRSATVKIIGTAIALLAYFVVSIQNEAKRVDSLALEPLNLGKVADGSHRGGFVYQNQLIEVSVTMEDQTLRDIKVVRNIKGDIYAKGAQALVSHILSTQRIECPTNATESIQQRAAKKALLHAILGALAGSQVPSKEQRSPRTAPGILFLLSLYAFCGSLGTQLAGYMAFRSGNIGAATMWVGLEDIAFFAGATCCGFGLLLTIT